MAFKIWPNYVQLSTLKWIHWMAIFLHLLSGSLGLYLIRDGNPKVEFIAPLFEYVSGQGEAFFVKTPKTIFTVPIFTPLVVVEFITATFHLIYYLAIVFPGVDNFLRLYIVNSPSFNPLRWVEYGITATMMASFGLAAIGVTDFYFFLRNVFNGVMLQGVGLLIEKLQPDRNRPVTDSIYKSLFWFQGMLNNLPFVGILLYQTFASTTHDALTIFIENSIPLAIWYNTFSIVCSYSYEEKGPFADPKFTEKWYILLSVSTKLAIFWTEFSTFKKITEDNGASLPVGVDWNTIRYMALSLPAALVIFVALMDYRKFKV
jgi:hypothetical protein